jgi:superfamily II DNA or RNA helicase
MVKTLKRFQELAVQSGVELFTHAKSQIDAAQGDAASRAHAVNHNGYLLIEAPTGSGKTLIAGNIVERFSSVEDVVWFWFAPFKGVVGQTAGFLREQFAGVRLREMSEDRATAGSRRGDIFVTTWQTVATRVKDSRNVRKDGEQNPSVDELIAGLRAAGLRIGVVADEAHHSFHGDTQAAKFFHEILAPEYTVLVTATPDDADVRDFEQRMGIAELHRIRVSRDEAVESGLIKSGVKCAAYFVDSDKAALVDLEDIALRDGVALHRKIKDRLAKDRVPLTPLLLVQVDSKDDEPASRTEASVHRVKERLLALGFTGEQIAVHTSKEPDAGLLAIANNEKIEVLIFKMAVALGFDAPRAFALVSMRASRDSDFGVQLVGRILRVHRRLQQRAFDNKLPDLLRYGYVFLADAASQTGLDAAGQRINQIQTEYAKISPTTAVVNIGGQTMIQVLGSGGQTSFFPTPAPVPSFINEDDPTGTPEKENFTLQWLTGDFRPTVNPEGGPENGGGARTAPPVIGTQHYALRAGIPRHFKTQVVSADPEVSEEDCAQRFIVSARDLLEALKSRVKVQRKTLDIFTHQMEFEYVGAALDPDQAARLANKALTRSLVFDARELRRALLRKLAATLREETMEEAEDPEKVAHLLNVILATNPQLLFEAQKRALAFTAELEEADELPPAIISEEPLPTSRFNVYGIIPPGLNSWERAFADYLDRDMTDLVRWWHRNLPHKPWSVNVLLPDGSGFFPDFVVSIAGRKKENGVLLTDPKFAFELTKEIPKTTVEHSAYGRVLILSLQGGIRWTTVRYDEAMKKPVLGDEFRVADAVAY